MQEPNRTLGEHKLPGLYMLWPQNPLVVPPDVQVPPGYTIGTYTPEDEPSLKRLLSEEGWEMNDPQWREYRDRLLPCGVFLLYHTASQALVGTAGAIHNPNPGRYYFPFGGELGNLVVEPQHRGRGLGCLLSALVVRRLLSAGYESIRVGVQGFRLPAIKTYLRVGFVPFVYEERLLLRWERILGQLEWPYTPEQWPRSLNEHVLKEFP